VLVHQAPHRGGSGAEFRNQLRHRPRALGDPVHQVGLHALEAKLGDPGGEALLGGAVSLAGEPFAAGSWGMWWSAMARRMAGWVVARWTASWGMLQPWSMRACRQPRRSENPRRLGPGR